MLTEYELTRLRSKVDEVAVLDSNLKDEILQSQLKEVVKKVEAKLKRTKGKVALMVTETR